MFLKNIAFLKKRSSVFYNVLALFSGTVIAQSIPIIISPLITRLYSPADFGNLSFFIGVSSIIAGIASGKYELAIVIPSKRIEAIRVALIAFLFSIITTIIVAGSTLILKYYNIGLFNIESDLLFYLPINVFLLSTINILNYWIGRNKQYIKISKGKISQSITSCIAQLSFGIYKISSYGLIKANIIGQIFFVILVGKNFIISLWRFKKYFNYTTLRDVFSRYKKFLYYYTPTTLLDNASLQAPILIITYYYDVFSTGLFGLAFRLISLPASLIGSAISQVYLQKLAELKNNGHNLKPFVMQTLKRLVLLAIGPTIFVIVFGRVLFSFVFGHEWEISGQIAQILAIPFAIRFVTSPLSPVLIVNEKFQILTSWQLIYFIFTFIVLFIGSYYPFITFFYFYAISETVMYLLYLFLIIKYSR